MDGNPPYSVKALANWILDFADSLGVSLSNMSLNKLVYFAYENVLRERGEKLTNAKIEAWEHGPVFREIYSEFKPFGSEPITARARRYNPTSGSFEFVEADLREIDQIAIRSALSEYVSLPAYILREISHKSGGAWDQVWNHATSSNPGMQITDESILGSEPTIGATR